MRTRANMAWRHPSGRYQSYLASGKTVGGLGILEDACHDTAQVAALPAEED